MSEFLWPLNCFLARLIAEKYMMDIRILKPKCIKRKKGLFSKKHNVYYIRYRLAKLFALSQDLAMSMNIHNYKSVEVKHTRVNRNKDRYEKLLNTITKN